MGFKKLIIIIITFLILISVIFTCYFFIKEKQAREECYNLTTDTNEFMSKLNSCYVSGVFDKERKEYLLENYKKKSLERRDGNNNILLKNVRMSPGLVQSVLSFNSDYCNNDNQFCGFCRLNFYNNSQNNYFKTVVFYQENGSSGMNFISNTNLKLLDDEFCFNLDCGEDESNDFCLSKDLIK